MLGSRIEARPTGERARSVRLSSEDRDGRRLATMVRERGPVSDRPPSCEFDADALELRVEEEIPCDVQAITPLVERVMAIAGQMRCAEGREFEIEMALREALANAIRHGCRHDPTKTVSCCVACDVSRGMLIVVRDPGPGFDPSSLPSPIRGQRLYEDHGRGIFLINQLMDEVRFEKGGTEIHMVKR